MSAFVVAPKHIHYLLTYANGHRYLSRDFSTPDALTDAANMLYRVNVEAVNTRYPADPQEYADIGFSFVTDIPADPVQVIKACNCYDYQACELPEYETTAAARLIAGIRSAAICDLPGYDDAMWAID
jgi:hypothetical protein